MSAYDFDGEKYGKASRHQKEWGTALIAGLSLGGDEHVLDLGCGEGGLTALLAEAVPRGKALGIDASEGMIAAARKREGGNLKFLLADIDDMDFDGEFDLIYSNAALHWVKDHDRLLKNCYAALNKGGRLLWNFAGEGTCSVFFGVVRELMESPKYKAYFQAFEWPWYMPTVDEYRRKIAAFPFSSAEVGGINADRRFTDKEEMIRWIDQPSIVPFLQALPQSVREPFRDDTVEAAVNRALLPDGCCFEIFRRIRVSAVK